MLLFVSDTYSEEELYHCILWKQRKKIVPEIKSDLKRILRKLKNDKIIPYDWNLDENVKDVNNTMALLDMISNLGEKGFHGFLAALDDCFYYKLADRLRLIQKKYFGPHEATTFHKISMYTPGNAFTSIFT